MNFTPACTYKPIPVAAKSNGWGCGHSLVGNVGSNPAGGMGICLLCVLSGKSLCDELITRLEDCY